MAASQQCSPRRCRSFLISLALMVVCLHLAGISTARSFVNAGSRLPAALLPACLSLSAASAPAQAASALGSAGRFECMWCWQPLLGSAMFVGTLVAILSKARNAGRLQEAWAAKADELRWARAAALAGKPLSADAEAALNMELKELLEQEEAERTLLCFELPQSPTPVSEEMAAWRIQCDEDASSCSLVDERTETVVCLGAVAVLSVFLLLVSA
eukprot:TRINITY_DN9784_c0_g1_i1.p1 TRINITY_DN9784_c0_g1~~TRINITY_DN9784_c0_g1_i1.p1  ORF type:complete len:214 (+),score=39.49 TRINITY_DN9784_c0_g1_i1:157-798(+)